MLACRVKGTDVVAVPFMRGAAKGRSVQIHADAEFIDTALFGCNYMIMPSPLGPGGGALAPLKLWGGPNRM